MSETQLTFLDSDRIQTIIKNEYQRVKSNLKNILHSTKFCGICLETDLKLIHIDNFTNIDNIPSDCAIDRIMYELFGDVITSNIASTYICENCKMEITQAYILMARIKQSSRILSSYFKQMTTQIESVEVMLNSANQCDFENTIIVLQDLDSENDKLKKRIVIPKMYDSDDVASEDSSNKVKFEKYTCECCSNSYCSKADVAHHIKTNKEYLNQHIEKCLDCKTTPCLHECYLNSIKTQRLHGDTELKCMDCEYACVNKTNLLAHINTEHLNLYPYLCEVCGKNFPSNKKYSNHMRQYHQEYFTCEYCDCTFDQLTIKTHTEACKEIQRFYKCKHCVASFDTEESLKAHGNMHSTKKLQCDLCSKKVRSRHFLKRHIYYGHHNQKLPDDTEKKGQKKDERARPCSICPLILYSLTDLKVHLTTHKPHEKHKCLTCKKQFDTRKQYNVHVSSWTHLKKVNPNIKFNFKCEECDFTCKSKLVMENHKNTVHLHVKPYGCDICAKMFTTAINLRYHMDRHRGVKRFQCSVCSNLFTSTSGLKKHVLRHHSEKRPYACNLCEKTFVNQSERNLHMLRNHSEKSVACPLCEVKFASMANLRAHTRKVHFKTKDGFDQFLNSDVVSREFYEMFRDHRLKF